MCTPSLAEMRAGLVQDSDTDQGCRGRKLSEQNCGSESGVIPFGNKVDFRVMESSRIHTGDGHTTTVILIKCEMCIKQIKI